MLYACSHTSQVSSGLSPRAMGVSALPVFSISSVPSAFFTSQVQPEPKLARAACVKNFLKSSMLPKCFLFATDTGPMGCAMAPGVRQQQKKKKNHTCAALLMIGPVAFLGGAA